MSAPAAPAGWQGFSLRLPFLRPPLLMNEMRSKTHWRTHHKAHRSIVDAVDLLCRLEGIPRFSEPVSVALTWHAATLRRRDPDSLAPMVKGCLDGLTTAGVIEDDASRFVHDVRLRVVTGAKDPRVELAVTVA